MEEVNWNNFKAKFHDHEQTAFERLCYLLFCKEHGKDTLGAAEKGHGGHEVPLRDGSDGVPLHLLLGPPTTADGARVFSRATKRSISHAP